MVRTRPSSRMITPLPMRSVPRIPAVKASSGTSARNNTSESSAVSRSNETAAGSGCISRGNAQLPDSAMRSPACGIFTEQGFAEAVPQDVAVARRQHERQRFRLDLDLEEKRAAGATQIRARQSQVVIALDHAGFGEPARAGDGCEIGAACGVGFLHPRFSVALVVEHDDGKVPGPLRAY